MTSHSSVCILVLLASATLVGADSTIDGTDKYAYSANSGWLNLRPDQPASPEGIVVGEYILSGHAFGANIGWIDFGDGSPVDGIRYENTSNSDYGVNHDGTGNLSGYAYGANIGWINFGWAASDDANRPRFNLQTGVFDGFAWSGNIGWISLGAGYLQTNTMHCIDTDSDGISDEWEREWFGDLGTADATTNQDSDPFSDKEEYLAQTNPSNPLSYLDFVMHDFNSLTHQADIEFVSSQRRIYSLMTSTNLVDWDDSGLGVFAPDTGSSTSRTVSFPSETLRFFIKVVPCKPLQP